MARKSQTRLLARCNFICNWFLGTRNYVRDSPFLNDDILGSMMLGILGIPPPWGVFFLGGDLWLQLEYVLYNVYMCASQSEYVLGSLSICLAA